MILIKYLFWIVTIPLDPILYTYFFDLKIKPKR